MKKIITFVIGIFLLVGCTNTETTDGGRTVSNYSTSDLIIGTIISTALYNNGISPGVGVGYGVGIGESNVKTHTDEVSSSNTTTSIGNDGSINTRTVTNTTTKSKSRGVSYGIGF